MKKNILIPLILVSAVLIFFVYLKLIDTSIMGFSNSEEASFSSTSDILAKKLVKNAFLKNKLGRNFGKETTYENKVVESPYQSCAVDICGSSESLFSVSELADLKRNRDPSVMKKFEELVESNVQANINLMNAKLNFKSKMKEQLKGKLKGQLQNKADLVVEDNVKKATLGIEYIGMLSDFMALYLSYEQNYGSLVRDSKKFWKSLRPDQVDSAIAKMSLKPKDKIWFKEMLSLGLLLDTKVSIFIINDLELETLLKLFYPNENPEVALKKQVQKIIEFSNMFNKSIGLDQSFSSLLFPTAQKFYLDPNAIYDAEDLTSEITGFLTIIHFFDQKYERILSRDFDWNEYISRVLDSNQDLVQWSKKSNLMNSLKHKIKNDCTDSLTVTLDQTNSILRNRKFRQYLADVVAVAKDQIQFLNSDHQAEFVGKLNSLNLIIPKDIFYLSKTIETTIELYTKQTELSENLMNKNPKTALQLLLVGFDFEESPDLEGLTPDEIQDTQIEWLKAQLHDDITEVCGMYMEPTLSDRMLGAHGQGKLSWSSIRFPKYGIGIAAHEIGHYVSELLMSMGKIQKGAFYRGLSEELPLWEARSCINSWYGQSFAEKFNILIGAGVPNPEKAFEEESDYTEEDWADYVGAKITGSMAKKYPWVQNFACQLLNKDKNGNFVAQLEPFFMDTHSSDFKRVLLVQKIMGNKMPQSCQKIINDETLFECIK